MPDFDVIVTNPPYSEDHMEKCIRFCVSTSKPWFLLLPNFVYMKDYYKTALTGTGKMIPERVFFVVPENRYQYYTPKGRHQKKSAVLTSPFLSFWYCHIGDHLVESIKSVQALCKKEKFIIARDITDLPDKVLDQNDPRAKKLKNIEKRKRRSSKNYQPMIVRQSTTSTSGGDTLKADNEPAATGQTTNQPPLS